jgi:hypothetical protein
MKILVQGPDAGLPHAIKEENYLLFGVVEEKALKTDSMSITFDFWTIRRNVLYDRFTNAAVVLQCTWRAFAEKKWQQVERPLRVAQHMQRGLSRIAVKAFAAAGRKSVAEVAQVAVHAESLRVEGA